MAFPIVLVSQSSSLLPPPDTLSAKDFARVQGLVDAADTDYKGAIDLLKILHLNETASGLAAAYLREKKIVQVRGIGDFQQRRERDITIREYISRLEIEDQRPVEERRGDRSAIQMALKMALREVERTFPKGLPLLYNVAFLSHAEPLNLFLERNRFVMGREEHSKFLKMLLRYEVCYLSEDGLSMYLSPEIQSALLEMFPLKERQEALHEVIERAHQLWQKKYPPGGDVTRQLAKHIRSIVQHVDWEHSATLEVAGLLNHLSQYERERKNLAASFSWLKRAMKVLENRAHSQLKPLLRDEL